MELLLALSAVFVSWVSGYLVVSALVPAGVAGRLAIVSGYGLFIGLLLTTVVMRLCTVLGIPFSAVLISALLLASGVAAQLLRRAASDQRLPALEQVILSPLEKLLIGTCLVLLLPRLGSLWIELTTLPMYAWDAKMHWAKTARVFLEHAAVVEHVHSGRWLLIREEMVYSSLNPNYPTTIPLVQTWVGVMIGRWHDVYVNLPWLFCFLSAGLIFYGQARAAGIRASIAVVGAYMLLSLPLLNSHVAMAGYADLFLATAFLGALAAFVVFSVSRQYWQGALLLASLGACLILKHEGFYWSLSLIAGAIVLLLGSRRGLLVIAGLAMTGLILLWLLPAGTIVAGHTIRQMEFAYRPESWYPLFEGMFLHDNWHLVFYLFVLALFGSLAWNRRALRQMAPPLVCVLSVLILYFVLYLFSGYARTAVDHTSLNRVAMHFVPAVLFITVVLYAQLADGVRRVSGQAPVV